MCLINFKKINFLLNRHDQVSLTTNKNKEIIPVYYIFKDDI